MGKSNCFESTFSIGGVTAGPADSELDPGRACGGSGPAIRVGRDRLLCHLVRAACEGTLAGRLASNESPGAESRWGEQSPGTQAIVRRLVSAGQLEFVEGGWCQADELVADLEVQSPRSPGAAQ